ncbi:thiamine-phosphate kinase [Caldimonas thermodepolymerans]|uniref:thiamine-phosphate kinase n=1 Tax=Caldimonas thermodepolymerans TaxID=215580 RepID=UPI002235F850|nr:thiamine-phosphate kinase [Caldimonas thermodepolymerans]UZG44717.1 thiamine-phosphate kinase [Caldimonas thermodepolymerans]
MSLGEFELIERYFMRPARRAALGVGDDCALLQPRPGMQLATSADLLLEGRHFLSTVAPERLGHKALAVNLSDLAACGAEPLGFLLSLALPAAEPDWLERFARGLFALADAHGCELVGGDTTRGPLAIHVTVFGEVPAGRALLRSGARAGDDLYVSGTLGDARLALEAWRGRVALSGEAFEATRVAMELPQPRVALGVALRGIASSAIDLSDGLVGDLGHVLRRSGAGATLQADALPRSAWLAAQPPEVQRLCTLAGGDDYELLFTAAPAQREAVQAAAAATGVPVTRIGTIEAEPGLRAVDAQGRPVPLALSAFDHFRP